MTADAATVPGVDDTAASPPRRSPTGVAVLVLTALIGILVLLWGGDRLARDAAETLIAEEVQRSTGTFATPEVEVHGESFLLQAVRGRYDRVDITVHGLSSGALRIERLEAQLSGVRLPFQELVLRNPELIVIDHAEERALLTYEDLDRYLEFTGRPFSVRPAAESDEVEIAGTVRILGRAYAVTVDAALGAENQALTVSPTRVNAGSSIGRAAELLLAERFDFVVPLDPLPFGQQVTDIRATPEGIAVVAEGDQVLLRPR